jgi:hypothetical protein
MRENDVELEKIEVMVARALAGGKISREESEIIKTAIYVDGKAAPQ